jgi:hypothetical protein
MTQLLFNDGGKTGTLFSKVDGVSVQINLRHILRWAKIERHQS